MKRSGSVIKILSYLLLSKQLFNSLKPGISCGSVLEVNSRIGKLWKLFLFRYVVEMNCPCPRWVAGDTLNKFPKMRGISRNLERITAIY